MTLCGVFSVHLFQDGNGYIDEQELDALLRDLYQTNKKVRPQAVTPRQTISTLYL